MKTNRLMLLTVLALLPGGLVMVWQFGVGVAINLLVSVAAAIGIEALMLKLRGRPLMHLADGSALLTGLLIALCLPPLLPVWMIVIANIFALVFAKHLYGGLGHNLFNPAMVGFAVLIVSFPLAMSQWPAPASLADDEDVVHIARVKFLLTSGQVAYDGITRATPLDAYKFRAGQTNDEFFDTEQTDNWHAWRNINLAFFIGGAFLIYLNVIPWQTPMAMLVTLGFLGLAFFDGGSSGSLGSPLFHLFSGATMLAAFFIVTDPVTSPGYDAGLLVFGAAVGLIAFIIRSIGAYPEGIAFAVLLMNACVPLIDHLLARPREQLQ